jgi:lipoprotein-anchoring transpeptidase ErfK/SrfK
MRNLFATPARRRWISVLVGVVVLASVGLYFALHNGPAARATHSSTAGAAPYLAPTAAEIAALPEAMYSAVIPGLMPYSTSTIPAAANTAYTLAADTPIYGAEKITPVARFDAKNFMLVASVVVPVKVDGPWTLVLTPSRQQLPSKDDGNAPAQTAGWVRTSALVKDHALPQHLVVSVSKQTISIVDAAGKVSASFPAGVGTSTAPTPTDVVGYLQARYLDPSQDEAVHPIQLTSLHSSAADEPYLGHDGGLIGVHYNATATGNVSHGCVRLNVAAIDAVNALPLGTLVTFVP